MKFRARQATHFLYLVHKNLNGLTIKDLNREARRAGKLGVDYHYIVQENGIVEEGREQYAIAGNQLENFETSIYILVDAGGKGKLTDAQEVSMRELLEVLELEFPDAQKIID